MKNRNQMLLCDVTIFTISLVFLLVLMFCHGSLLMLATLVLFFCTAAALSLRMHAFTHEFGKLGVFFRNILPCGIRLLIAVGTDVAVFYFIRRYVDFAVVWLALSLLLLVSAFFVIAAVGAARTVLYHDRKS